MENQPPMGRMMAFETRYDVRTHVDSSTVAERLPAMCGSATLATLVSSTSMQVASMTVMAMIHGLTVLLGVDRLHLPGRVGQPGTRLAVSVERVDLVVARA